MQRNGIPYILGFCVAICLACAVVVSTSAVGLKEQQELNKELDRKSKVLAVAGLITEGQATPDEIQDQFAKRIKPIVVNLESGAINEELTKNAATFDQHKEAKDPELGKNAPKNPAGIKRIPSNATVYLVSSKEMDGEGNGFELQQYIFPVEGKGLWSTLYGFFAVAPDFNEVKGLTFYAHLETPGLGGEVDNPDWKALWKGRRVFGPDGSKIGDWEGVKLSVIKGKAGSAADDPYQVDGLSGATITSKGVTYLIEFWMGENGFGNYIKNTLGGAAS